MKKILNNFKGIIMLVIFLITTLFVNAQKTATASGPWSVATTWTPSGAPGVSDNVTINTGVSVSVNTTAVCNSLTVNGTVSLTSATAGNDITISSGGNVTVNSGGLIVFNDARVIKGGTGGPNGILVTINSGASLTTASAIGFMISGGSGSFSINPGGRGNPVYNTLANYTFNNMGDQSTGTGITGAANLTFDGSGTKNLSATTTVTGILSMKGSATLSSSPTYGASSTLEYNGSGIQTTGAEFPTSGVKNLKIDNTNGVILNSAKTITAALTLTDGILTTTSTNLLTIDVLGSASVGSNTSFVNGPMAKIGTSAFTFPVGKSGAGIRAISISAPSAPSTFRAEFNRAPATNRSAVSGGLTQVSACEHWVLDRPSGSGTASVTLSWSSSSPCNGALYVTNLSDLKVARYTGSQWANEGNASTGGDNANGTITSNTVTTFSPFALASSNSATNPLPVKFTDVKAFEKGNAVQIEWTNQTESDMVNYLVERSLNGNDFSAINTVDARSNLSSKESYISMDGTPSTGVNYYRIKAVEVSGKIVYSNTVKVIKGAKQQELLVYPNPVIGNDIAINFTAPKGTYNVNLFNAAGQQVMQQQLNHPGGTIAQTIGLPFNSQSGMYNLQITGDNYRANKMLIIQK